MSTKPRVQVPRSALAEVLWPALPGRIGATVLALQQQFEASQWWPANSLLGPATAPARAAACPCGADGTLLPGSVGQGAGETDAGHLGPHSGVGTRPIPGGRTGPVQPEYPEGPRAGGGRHHVGLNGPPRHGKEHEGDDAVPARVEPALSPVARTRFFRQGGIDYHHQIAAS